MSTVTQLAHCAVFTAAAQHFEVNITDHHHLHVFTCLTDDTVTRKAEVARCVDTDAEYWISMFSVCGKLPHVPLVTV